MTTLELERIATLANHPGFAALLKLLDEADELLLSKLETATKEKEAEILPLWRASRRIRKQFEGRPEALLETLGRNLGEGPLS